MQNVQEELCSILSTFLLDERNEDMVKEAGLDVIIKFLQVLKETS